MAHARLPIGPPISAGHSNAKSIFENRVVLENKLNISSQVELAKTEERLTKLKAKVLYDSGDITRAEIGTYSGLAYIHRYLFEEIYEFAGKLRTVNISKGGFRFVPVLYLQSALEQIDSMPQRGFEQVVEKYVEMNVAHPFREGNGRAMRIWLDLLLKAEVQRVVDWNQVDKDEYLDAMQLSVVNDAAIKGLIEQALTDRIDDRALYLEGIDVSYYYEGYSEFKTEDL